MTATFLTNTDNDLYLENDGSLAFGRGLPAIIAACETATKAQLGEMVLQTGQGIPNFQTVWVGTPNFSLYNSYIIKTLESIEGVQEVQSLDLSILNNVLNYVATIKTTFGNAVING